MKRLNVLMLSVLLFPCVAAGQVDNGALLAKIAKSTENALVTVRCTYGDEGDKRDLAAIGVCYDAEKGEFLTLIFEGIPRSELIKNVQVVIPGVEQESIDAEFLGMHPTTKIAFVRAKEKRNWEAVKFAARSNLQVGDVVASAGLIPGDRVGTKYYGVGYVSAMLRVPQTIHYVTGGRLTCIGSPVFGPKGLVIGIVGQTLFMDYYMLTRDRPATVTMKGRHETAFFVPVEEFVYALKEIPRGGSIPRLPWLGALNIVGVEEAQAELLGLNRPGAQIDTIIPGTAAEKAGLKTGDVIVAVDGEPLERLTTPALTAQGLLRKIQRKGSGQEITLRLHRSGKEEDVSLTLTDTPPLPSEARRYFNKTLGLAVREKVMLDEYLDKSSVAKIAGLPVIGVGKRSPADDGGLQPKDLVTAANGQPVNTVETFKEIVEEGLIKEPTRSVVLLIRRGDQEPQAISIRPPTR